ncbi:hypothetical protein Rt10032_c01g0007 [Rhodotorula toruloides]|uniref:Reverse transcriptase Ty1/copia-type domain-containing protein n=1 Tax=Rhodotorula toruloides TaxID=5286 RepID=A0A511K6L7_RHOTO|nr:hypothetical protein Rt10032_c01g0007 [Rhodotorula toruloides]
MTAPVDTKPATDRHDSPGGAVAVPSRPTPLPTDSHLRSADNYDVWCTQLRGLIGPDAYKVMTGTLARGVHHYIALYVDDLLFVSPSLDEITHVKAGLKEEYGIKDLGPAKFILGIQIHQRSDGSLFLSQRAYPEDVLLRLDPNGCRTAPTPMVPNQQLVPAPDDHVPTPDFRRRYLQAVCSLMYAMLGTRVDLAHVVGVLGRDAARPDNTHWAAVLRALQYIRGTLDYGLEYTPDSSPLRGFEAYSDPDWGACPTTSRSTMGYVFLLANGAVSWSSKLQPRVTASLTEAEYLGLSHACKETVYLTQLLGELGFPAEGAAVLYGDNQGANALSKDPQFHNRTRHLRRSLSATTTLSGFARSRETLTAASMTAPVDTKPATDRHDSPGGAVAVPSRPTPLPTDSHLRSADNYDVCSVIHHVDSPRRGPDIDKAYLHGSLDDELYMRIPEGIDSGEYSGKVLKWPRLVRAQGRPDAGVHHYIALYVDDLLFVSPSLDEITHVKAGLKEEYGIKDLGPAKFILGIQIHQRSDGSLFLSQRAYPEDVLLRLDPNGCRTAPTPMVPNQQLVPAPDDHVPTPDFRRRYLQAVCSLMYAMLGTRVDLAHVVGVLGRDAARPDNTHWAAVLRALQYIRGTLDYGLEYTPDSSPLRGFEAYSDPDWGACPTTSRSTMGYVFLLANGAVSWSSKLQPRVTASLTEAEYLGLSHACKETVYLTQLLGELGFPAEGAAVLYGDNQGANALSKDPQFHNRTRHLRRSLSATTTLSGFARFERGGCCCQEQS